MRKKLMSLSIIVLIFAGILSGCADSTAGNSYEVDNITDEIVESAFTEEYTIDEMNIEDEIVALSGTPAVSSLLMPAASGVLVKKNDSATIDYSNTADGYVMVMHQAASDKRLKVQVKKTDGVTYTYDLTPGESYTAMPLSEGSGKYKVSVYKNTTGTKYSTVLSVTFDVTLKDEFSPFLYPNQYVNYNDDTKVVAKAAELTEGMTDTLEMVGAIYNYVVKNYTYDYDKAASVKSGYLPVLDDIYTAKKGICFDYAAVMTAMLRSQGIPAKLVIGYTGDVYHAWINVYSEETGWISGAIYFSGTSWKLMDPTFASSAKESEAIMKYIGNGANYSAKYVY